MSVTRYTEAGQESRKGRLEELRKRLETIKRLNNSKDTLGWKDLKSILEGFISSEDNAIKLCVIACAMGGYYDPIEKGIRKETNDKLVSDLRVAHERKSGFQLIIDLIEKTDDQIEHVAATIKHIEAQFKEAKEQLA